MLIRSVKYPNRKLKNKIFRLEVSTRFLDPHLGASPAFLGVKH